MLAVIYAMWGYLEIITHHSLSLDKSHSEQSALDSRSERENPINDCVPTGTLVNDDRKKNGVQWFQLPCKEEENFCYWI